MKLLVIDRESQTVTKVEGFEAADAAAKMDGLGTECIEHCIEEYGRCDGSTYTIIPEEWEEWRELESLKNKSDPNAIWFCWDEISNEITEWKKSSLDKMNAEGGWKGTFQYENGVVRRSTDRHIALEVQAANREMAIVKFQVACVEFRNGWGGK